MVAPACLGQRWWLKPSALTDISLPIVPCHVRLSAAGTRVYDSRLMDRLSGGSSDTPSRLIVHENTLIGVSSRRRIDPMY